jgi:hypothetical protein
MQGSVRSLFPDQGDALAEVNRSARQAETLIKAISPLIERYTSVLCPECTSICCIDRHSRFDRSDIIFMAALGKQIPEESPAITDTDACRFLGRSGCNLKRSQRPYRCTWFFCSALLDLIIQQATAAEYRKFMEMLQKITTHRTAMINDFETLSTKITSPLYISKENK